MDKRNRPQGVTADRARRTVTIGWQDGHESIYSYAGLRAECPCVMCRGGHANMNRPADPRLVRDASDDDIALLEIKPVGSYALQFVWSDGHSSGIYTWSYLRAACPCESCIAAYEAG